MWLLTASLLFSFRRLFVVSKMEAKPPSRKKNLRSSTPRKELRRVGRAANVKRPAVSKCTVSASTRVDFALKSVLAISAATTRLESRISTGHANKPSCGTVRPSCPTRCQQGNHVIAGNHNAKKSIVSVTMLDWHAPKNANVRNASMGLFILILQLLWSHNTEWFFIEYESLYHTFYRVFL